MPQSAMSAIAPSTCAVDGPDGPMARALLRDSVLAGPAAGVDIGPALGDGFLRRLAGGEAVAEALARAGHVDVRRRELTGPATVDAVLGLCLFSGEGYDSVLARVFPDPPTGSALSQARARLEGDPLRELFELTADPVRGADEDEQQDRRAPAPGSTALGLRLSAVDGTVFDLAAAEENAAEFAVPTGGKHPQARLVTLNDCGTRRVRAAAAGSYATSEQELVDPLGGALRPGELNLCDRNLFSMARWVAFSATGAQLAWRVKNGKNSLPAKTVAVLPDGSTRVRLRESSSMLARRRAKAGDPTLARLADTIARLVEFDVRVTDAAGKTKTSRYRILTTLLDHQAYPAKQIAAVYAERWQVEIAYYRIKVTLRGAGVILRGRTPRLARQEIWGMLIVYNALCDLATQTAVSLGVDPDQISFRRHPPHPSPPGRRQPRLLTLRPARRPRPHRPSAARRHRRMPAQPNRPATHQPPHHSPTPNRAHPQRHLHHRDRHVESTQSGLSALNFRAVRRARGGGCRPVGPQALLRVWRGRSWCGETAAVRRR